MLQRKDRRERGSSLVEMALVLLVFLLFLIGILDFGQVLYYHQALVERARAAVRYGSIDPTNTTAIQNMAVYNTTDGSGSVVLSGLTTAMVNVVNSNASTSQASVVVTISGFPMQFLSPYIAQSFNNRPVMAAMMAESQVP